MPGICGSVGAGPLPNIHAALTAMMAEMKHHPWYVEQAFADAVTGVALGRVSLGLIDRAEQPASNEDGSLRAVLHGEIYTYAECRQTLEAAGHRFNSNSPAELLLHGIEEEGQQFLGRLRGAFAAAIWDRAKRRLILCNDRLGMRPLYYAEAAGRFLFASKVTSLLMEDGVSREINLRGLAQFFTYGQFLGDDTFFEHVRLLPAAGWLVYEQETGKVTCETYHPSAATDSVASTDEALERIDAAFKTAVDRCANGAGRLGLSLSSGLDARTILGALDPRCAITCVTMGIEGSIDHRGAEQMARLTGRPFHRFVLDARFLADFARHMRQMVHLTDGHYLSQCIVMPTLPFYRQLGIDVLLRGHAGELMHMEKAYNFSVDRRAMSLRTEADLENWLAGRLGAHMLDDTTDVFAPQIKSAIASLARDSLRECLRASRAFEHPLHRIMHLFLSQRLRRETALSLVKFGSMMETRLPYLDPDVLDALFAAPPDLKIGDTIQGHILRRRMPSFLEVVNSNTGTRLGAPAWRRALAKARLKVLAKLRVPGYQPYERLGLWLRRELRPFVESLLLSSRFLERGLFAPDGVRSVVRAHLNGGANHTFLLLALMIFELGQRQLVDGERLGDAMLRSDAVGSAKTEAIPAGLSVG